MGEKTVSKDAIDKGLISKTYNLHPSTAKEPTTQLKSGQKTLNRQILPQRKYMTQVCPKCNIQHKGTFPQKENHEHGEQACGFPEGGRERVWEFGGKRCKVLPLEWISNEIWLYSTGNYTQSLTMKHDNVRKKNVYTCV